MTPLVPRPGTPHSRVPVLSALRQVFFFAARSAATASAYADTLLDTARHFPRVLRPPGRRVLLKQVYFTGIEALPLMTVTALVTGFGSISMLHGVLLQDLTLTLEVFRLLIAHEASVLIVTLFVLARSGSAVAAELADMRQRGEVAALCRMGIDPASYLVAPRVTACLLAVPALTASFQLVLVLGGLALMALLQGWDFRLALEIYGKGLQPERAFLALAKSCVFGAVIGAICCRQGLSAAPGPLGIPGATRTAMVHSFTAIVIGQALFIILFG